MSLRILAPQDPGNGAAAAFDLSMNSTAPYEPGGTVVNGIQTNSRLNEHLLHGGAASPSEIMKPPPPPAPTSRRGRGRGRGAAAGSGGERGSGRGRGRGRGRGAKAAAAAAAATVTSGLLQQQQQQQPLASPTLGGLDYLPDVAASPAANGGSPAAIHLPAAPVEGGSSNPGDVQTDSNGGVPGGGGAVGSFALGSLSVPENIFDKLLNPRKLELLQDPEVAQLLSGSRKLSGQAALGGRGHHRK